MVRNTIRIWPKRSALKRKINDEWAACIIAWQSHQYFRRFKNFVNIEMKWVEEEYLYFFYFLGVRERPLQGWEGGAHQGRPPHLKLDPRATEEEHLQLPKRRTKADEDHATIPFLFWLFPFFLLGSRAFESWAPLATRDKKTNTEEQSLVP